MASGLGSVLNIIGVLIDHHSDFVAIKNDATLKPVSKKFGVKAIVLSLFGLALIPLTVYLIASILRGMSAIPFFEILGIIILGFVLLYEVLGFVIYGLLCTISQLRLNRKAISWIALVLYVIFIAGSLVIIASIL